MLSGSWEKVYAFVITSAGCIEIAWNLYFCMIAFGKREYQYEQENKGGMLKGRFLELSRPRISHKQL